MVGSGTLPSPPAAAPSTPPPPAEHRPPVLEGPCSTSFLPVYRPVLSSCRASKNNRRRCASREMCPESNPSAFILHSILYNHVTSCEGMSLSTVSMLSSVCCASWSSVISVIRSCAGVGTWVCGWCAGRISALLSHHMCACARADFFALFNFFSLGEKSLLSNRIH